MKATILSASVLALFLVGLAPLPQLLAASSSSAAGPGATLSPVQVSIQTKNLTAVGSYDLVAYNSTGTLAASYSGQYPRVAFELPSGTYLLAANAQGPSPTQSPICYSSSQSKTAAPPPIQAPNSGAGSSAIVAPCYYSSPPSEYGFSLVAVSGPTAVNIATHSPSTVPTSDISVTVSYKNGTVVSDAYVYANVVGDWNWGDVQGVTMYAQTKADGVAHLVVPAVPLSVTASKSVQVALPKGQSTVQVNVGGELVNVTVYYSPNYVYLSAAALVIPPQTSLHMTLTAQPTYRPIPYAAGSVVPGQAGLDSGAAPTVPAQGPQTSPTVGGVQIGNSSQTSQAASIPPIPISGLRGALEAQPSSNPSVVSLIAIGTVAVAGVLAAVVGLAISKAKG